MSSCPIIGTIHIDEPVELLPKAVHGLENLKHVLLQSRCVGLDLLSSPNIEGMVTKEPLAVLSKALQGHYVTIDRMSYFPYIETLHIDRHVTVLPKVLHGLLKL